MGPEPTHLCATCGTQYPPAAGPPSTCPICLDERQYVPVGGQRWISAAELAATHANEVRALEPGLVGIGTTPRFAIGQRALLVEGLLWDCISLLDAATADAVDRTGGLDTIAVSHPHYYSAMVDWARRWDARILLHEADREWVMRPDRRIEHWGGERLALSSSLELIHIGGHFAGATVCRWSAGAGGRGALLSGDVVYVAADRRHVSFMRSYPNLVPLSAAEVRRIGALLAGERFDRIYGAWWDSVLGDGAAAAVQRSVARYVRAIEGDPSPAARHRSGGAASEPVGSEENLRRAGDR